MKTSERPQVGVTIDAIPRMISNVGVASEGKKQLSKSLEDTESLCPSRQLQTEERERVSGLQSPPGHHGKVPVSLGEAASCR